MIESFDSESAAAVAANGRPAALAGQDPPSIEGLLFAAGAISADQLGEAVRDAVLTQRPVVEVALERGFVTRDRLAELLPAGGVAAPPVEAPGNVDAASATGTPALEPELARTVAPMVQPIAPVLPQAAPVVTVAVQPPTPQPAPVASAPLEAPVLASVLAASVEERVRAVAHAAEHPLPAPLPAPVPSTQPAPAVPAAFAVSIRLESGEQIAVDTAETLERATELARAMVETVSGSGEWPFVSGRFVRPAAVVSIDIERALGA